MPRVSSPNLNVAAALLLLVAVHVPAARAATARCGMTVGEKLVLDRDLRCVGPALIVKNPRTVVQLNGHVLESAIACGEHDLGVGITVQATADRTQILGPGVVRGFQTGISVDGAGQVQLRDVRISDSCTVGLAVHVAGNVRARNLVLDRNGNGGDVAGAIRIERAARFWLADSDVFLNDAGANGAAVDLHGCEGCRIAGNRIVANRGAGLRLDDESRGNDVERNLIVGQRPNDVVDQGPENVFALNGFERGDGVDPPSAWPLLGVPAAPAPGVAGCGTMTAPVGPRASVTVACPQDTGLRAVRNSVVAYRLLSGFDPAKPFTATCTPGVVQSATGTAGGSVTCTNPESIWPALLEVTCCLN